MQKEKLETCSHCGEPMLDKKVTLLRKKKGKIYVENVGLPQKP